MMYPSYLSQRLLIGLARGYNRMARATGTVVNLGSPGYQPRVSNEPYKPRAEGTPSDLYLIKYKLFVKRHPHFIQYIHIFLLERSFAMMLFLIENVSAHLLYV